MYVHVTLAIFLQGVSLYLIQGTTTQDRQRRVVSKPMHSIPDYIGQKAKTFVPFKPLA